MQIRSASTDTCEPIEVDDNVWSKISLHELPQHQRFCLRTQLFIKENTFDAASLNLSMLASSKIYWDEQLIYENGVVGTNKLSEQPGKIDVVVQIPSPLLSDGSHNITIDVSNFYLDNNIKTYFYGLRILNTDQVYDYIISNAIFSAFILGCLFIFSLLFQLLYWLYQRQPLYQLFSLLCLFSACLLLTEKWRVMFGLNYDLQSVRLQLVMLFTFINCLLLPSFYLIYYQSSYKAKWFVIIVIALLASMFISHDYDDKSIAMYFSSLLATLLINLLMLKKRKVVIWANTLIIFLGIIVFSAEPTKFTEDRFSLTLFAIISVMLVSLIQEMKNNRMRSLASIRLEAELLKRNLHPHFLMNSLMLVIEWIEEKPNAAADFVQALAEELRMLVKFSGQPLVTLEEELSLCQRHIKIMSYRYNTEYTLNVIGLEKAISIPPAIIHTQIENAFSHNIIPDNACFTLEVIRQKNQIILTLTSPFNSSFNSSPNEEGKQKNHDFEGIGIGERYIQSRLRECFNHNFSYQSYSKNDTWINIIQFKVKE